MREIRSAALIVNAQSRRGRKLFKHACRRLRDLPFKVSPHAVKNPAHLDRTVRQALEAKPDLVILGGGDGTISGLVDLLVGHDVVLGVLPLGTANSFARTLGLPLDIDGAIDVLASGVPQRIDLGMIDRDYFANCAAIGISPQIAETVPHKLKKVAGRVGYLGWAAYQLGRFRPFTLFVDDGSGEKELRVVEVRISNGPYHGGTWLVDEASVTSGLIVVQAVREVLDEVDQLREQFLSLKRARFSGTHLPPVPKLRRQIQELEIKQMTSSMSIKKERELVEKIGALQTQITAQDEMMDGDEEVAAARDLFRAGEKKRKELTHEMKRVRDEAQNAHELMREALKANRVARRKADAAQRAFVNSKEQADEVHADYIEQLRQLSAIDKVVAERRKGGTGASAIESVANAEELFGKFLAGEKLSTEQLMIIQKAGML